MTTGTSAFQRENGHHIQPTAPATIGSAALSRARFLGAEAPTVARAPLHVAPRVTWIGPMEVMMEGCRYRLVPADTPANQVEDIAPPAVESLTPREAQIARLVGDGLVNKEIATRLSISEWTVGTHMRRIFQKLGVETRAAMVLRCFGAKHG